MPNKSKNTTPIIHADALATTLWVLRQARERILKLDANRDQLISDLNSLVQAELILCNLSVETLTAEVPK